MSEPHTIVTCLTPPGTGAIAVLAVFGPRAWEVMRELFRPASGPSLPDRPGKRGTIWFGRIGDGAAADEVVLILKDLDPDPYLELNCHGGRRVVEWLSELLASRGLEALSWNEAAKLLMAPVQAEALRLLALASTARTAAILLDQLREADWVAHLRIRELIDSGRHDEAARQIDEILRHAEVGRHLTEPWRVVVAGPPNVGKSSLVNALAGYARSVVAPVAGTTRDAVSVALAIDGWPVELIDTAGLREAAGGLEGAGIERAREVIRSADLVLWVVDATAADSPTPDADACAALRLLVIANKCDLPTTQQVAADLMISALTGDGIASLCTLISCRLVPVPPSPGTAVPIQPSQVALLRQLRESLPGSGGPPC